MELQQYAAMTWGEDADFRILAGDASGRLYARVAPSGARSIVLCARPDLIGGDPNRDDFLVVGELFAKAGVAVPRIHTVDTGHGVVVMEDAGDVSLQRVVCESGVGAAGDYYRSAVRAIVGIQGIARTSGAPFDRGFHLAKYLREIDLFLDFGLGGCWDAAPAAEERAALRQSLGRLAEALDRPQDYVLAHRDFQSRNLFVTEGRLLVIDFQDALLALPHYDLASLLYDPYVELPPEMVRSAIRWYREEAAAAGLRVAEAEEFEALLTLSAFERLLQATGVYGFQALRRGNRAYLPYAAKALRSLRELAGAHDLLEEPWRRMEAQIGAMAQ